MAVNVKGFNVAGIDLKAPPERTATKWEQAVVSGGAAGALRSLRRLVTPHSFSRNERCSDALLPVGCCAFMTPAEPFIEVTYLDYDMRISRNHAGYLFVFTRPPVET